MAVTVLDWLPEVTDKLVCYTPLSTNYSQFYWWKKAECHEKITDLPQVTNKLFLYQINMTRGGLSIDNTKYFCKVT
jgi:hypothetical protein